eukprot:2893249-Pleurochrysis_carterae.AAC.3
MLLSGVKRAPIATATAAARLITHLPSSVSSHEPGTSQLAAQHLRSLARFFVSLGMNMRTWEFVAKRTITREVELSRAASAYECDRNRDV